MKVNTPFRLALEFLLQGANAGLSPRWIARLDEGGDLSDSEYLELADMVCLAVSDTPWTGESILDSAELLAERAVENANLRLDVRSPYPTWIRYG